MMIFCYVESVLNLRPLLKDLMKKYLNHIWTIPQVADSTERDKTRIPGNSKYSTY